MVATGELIQLPLLMPVQLSARERRPRQHYLDATPSSHRIHRRTARKPFMSQAYGPGGLPILDQQKGRLLDIYA